VRRPATYIRDDRAIMVEVSPHCCVNEDYKKGVLIASADMLRTRRAKSQPDQIRSVSRWTSPSLASRSGKKPAVTDEACGLLVAAFVNAGMYQVIKEGLQADEKWKVLKRPTITVKPKSSTWAQASRASKGVEVTPMLSRAWDKGKTPVRVRSSSRDRATYPMWDWLWRRFGPKLWAMFRYAQVGDRVWSESLDRNGKMKFLRDDPENAPKPLKFAKVKATRPRPPANYDTSYVSVVKRRVRIHCKHQKDIKFDDALSGVLELMIRYNDIERYDRTKSSLKTYLNHVVTSRFTDFARSHKAANKLEIAHSINDRVSEEKATVEEKLCARAEDEDRLAHVIEEPTVIREILTGKEFEVVVGTAIDGKSIKELAEETGVSTQRLYELRLSAKIKIADYYSNSTSDSAGCA
jgi:DNA-directed RNA polymerase specialized sigma24 family protein